MTDDKELEDALREGLAHRTAELEIPSGMGHRGRRTAQRRSATRAAIIAAPALAVVVVVALLVGARTNAPRAVSTQQVVREVSDRVTQISRTGGVLETITTGPEHLHAWWYTDLQNGITYNLMRFTNARGKLLSEQWNRARPLGGGRVENRSLNIYGSTRTWTTGHAVTRAQGAQTSIQSTARQIARALKRGTVTLEGKASVEGHPALKLRLHYHIRGSRYELYVDPHTYRPIEQRVHINRRGFTEVDRIFLRPPTPSNIAMATTKPAIPKGFKFFKTGNTTPRFPPHKHTSDERNG